MDFKHIYYFIDTYSKFGGVYMNEICLTGGIVIRDNRNKSGYQDNIEIKLPNGKKVILTATACGKIKVGNIISSKKGNRF